MSQAAVDRKPIGIVILAAGGSTRFGSPKQLFVYQGESLIRRAARTALDVSAGPVLISLGAEYESIKREIADLNVTTVLNPDWQKGISSSLTSALNYLIETYDEIEAVLFMLCDQPRIDAVKLAELINSYQATAAPIVASEYNGTLGVPALFDQSVFDELFQLAGDRGARSLIEKHVGRAMKVPMPEAGLDIDSLGDIE